MSLKPCKECKQEVSTDAKVCPHCGVKHPTVTSADTAKGCLGLIVAAVVIGGLLSMCSSDDDTGDTDTTENRVSDEECRQDLQCWGDRSSATATIYCPSLIEKLAKYDSKWTDGMLEAKFSHFSWNDKEKGIINYFGDKIQFQNGFGAWQTYTYSCTVDTINKKVVDYSASLGRI